MHVCLPHRWQLNIRPDSSTTASHAAPFSGRERRDRRYASVATVDHRDGPEGSGGTPSLRFVGAPMVDPSARAGQLSAGDDRGGDLAQDAVHRLSTGAHNLPVSPPRPPSSTGSGVAAHPAAPRRYDGEVSVGEEI